MTVRVLKPGPRPAIAFAFLLGILAAILLPLSPAGSALEVLKGVALLGAVLAMLLVNIYLSRIVVADDYIASKAGLLPEQRIRFEEIRYSRRQILAEPEHPVFLDVVAANGELRIRLKAFRTEDVRWLLSLPQLKVTR